MPYKRSDGCARFEFYWLTRLDVQPALIPVWGEDLPFRSSILRFGASLETIAESRGRRRALVQAPH